MVLPAAPSLVRGRDALQPYRPDAELFYLTGFAEPEAVAVLRGFADEERFVLFVPGRNREAERWDGPRRGPEEAQSDVGADATYPLHELEERLPSLLEGADAVHFRMRREPTSVGRRCQEAVLQALGTARSRGARHGTGPRSVVDPGEVLDELRLIKGPEEVERVRRAADVTAEAFREALALAAPGRSEAEVQARLEAGFRRRGAQSPAFASIVGSGANACVLHYIDNAAAIGADDLVLVDGGAEVDLYAADATRTVPASGVFSGGQRDLYEVVEEARRAAVDLVAPDVRIDEVHHASVERLVDGLLQMGVLEGSMDEVIEKKAYRRYFPHHTSHWLGMDVHDPGDYARDGESRRLRPGMALTVEPGLYIPDSGPEGEAHAVTAAEEALKGIGIRIEDSVLVTEEGRDVLTGALPTEADEVAGLVEGRGHGV